MMHTRTWHTSSYSSGQGNCVEVATTPQAALVRDTKNRSAGHLTVGEKEWKGFLATVTR